MSEDIISLAALGVSIVGMPITYYLAIRNAKNNECNKEIDSLCLLSDDILKTALDIYGQQPSIQTYHLMIAYHKKLQIKCETIKEIGDFEKYPRDTIRKIKQIITDKLYQNNSGQALASLIILLSELERFYRKKFY